MSAKTSISPTGQFIFGIHKPKYTVDNLRESDFISDLGLNEKGKTVKNEVNFPERDVEEKNADWIYEIPNAFPFRGTTYIARRWAEAKSKNPAEIKLPSAKETSLKELFAEFNLTKDKQSSLTEFIKNSPDAIRLSIATCSTNPEELIGLAKYCCEFLYDGSDKQPKGLRFQEDSQGIPRAIISDFPLFEAVANNPHLPYVYKNTMVLKPGVQGGSEIVGEWTGKDDKSHIFEYLRRNSYIPWGHYAANMANDAVRYDINSLSLDDIRGLRHLYYQRTFFRLNQEFHFKDLEKRKQTSPEDLESLRVNLHNHLTTLDSESKLSFNRTLWGWNFGFDFAPSHYRLHASHQQVHQQYAMIPNEIEWYEGSEKIESGEKPTPYACGDLIESFTSDYKKQTGKSFFDCFIEAIRSNQRLDGRTQRPQNLVVYENEHVIVFVPKAQTSQWELQLMTLPKIGNILEADQEARESIDKGIFAAVKALSGLGAKMITSIEFSKRFDSSDSDQRLMYSFLPKLPESPGAFSEAQLRWINGHYPEDFAIACRNQIPKI